MVKIWLLEQWTNNCCLERTRKATTSQRLLKQQWHIRWDQRTYFSSAIPGNMTKDCHDWCTRIYTGLTFLNKSVTNFIYWHIDVSSVRLQCTCRTTAHRYPKLLHDSICVQPFVTGWWFRDIAQHVRPSGIRCRWPNDLQRCARWAARPHRQHNNFQTTFKDTFFLELSTCLAH